MGNLPLSMSERPRRCCSDRVKSATDVVPHPLAHKPKTLWNQHWKQERTVTRMDPPVSPDAPIREDAVRFVCISDTHNYLRDMVDDKMIPAGDVLLHCGDFTDDGGKEKIIEFNDALGLLPHPHKIVIAGNHELGFDGTRRDFGAWGVLGTVNGYELLNNCTYLQDSSTSVYGIKIYGSPWQPMKEWAFGLDHGKPLMDKWQKIPNDVDVLMTHTPPLGHMDGEKNECWGSPDLLDIVEKWAKPKYHVFGHIHESRGVTTNGETVFINCAVCHSNVNKGLANGPICFDVELPAGHTKS